LVYEFISSHSEIMEREIKFRAVIPERNTTIFFDLSDLVHPARKDLFSKRELLIPWLLAGNIPDLFTGLKDKNGKEVYEGDVVRHDYYYEHGQWGERKSFTHTIKWNDERCGFYPMFATGNYEFPRDSIEIIGNIYESPELLESK